MSMKTLSARMEYNGGANALDRIRMNKRRSFLKAVTNTYNARMIKTCHHQMVPCLISPYLIKADYDRSIISVDFSAQLTEGDTFECLDDGTHWMIYLPKRTETAYLKSEIIRCRYSLDIDGVTYWVYGQGSTETDIRWFQKMAINANELNLSGTIYIKKDARTAGYFHRFDTLRLNGKVWEVQVVDEETVPGIIELEIQEYYTNVADDLPKIKAEGCHEIMGRESVEQDHEYGFQIRDAYFRDGYEWSVEGNERVSVKETLEDGRMCVITVAPGAVRGFDVIYGNGQDRRSLHVSIARKCNGVTGPKKVYPYDIVEYVAGVDGTFNIDAPHTIAKIVSSTPNSCVVEIASSRKNEFDLYFNPDEFDTQVVTHVEIGSL